jgi:hypothetical protein
MRSASELPFGTLPADQIIPALPKGVWFSNVGGELSDVERAECRHHLAKIGKPDAVTLVRSWEQAYGLITGPTCAACLEYERAEERRLFELACAHLSADAVLLRLSNLMRGSADLFRGPATVACSKAAVSSPAIPAAAIGCVSQSLHQYGLARLAGQDEEHFFAAKFRLFLGGRWPLGADATQFYLF